MKKLLSLFMSVVMLALCSSLFTPVVTTGSQVSAAAPSDAVDKATETRFLNMLNHNFVYDDDFDDIDTIVNNSVLALLDLRDSENEDYIKQIYVKDFVNNMYGIEIADMGNLNAEFPQIEGYIYIIPRGYTDYSHKIISAKQNPDGSYTVVSEVAVKNHDGAGKTEKAESLFIKNENSAFGYNMIYCNFVKSGSEI